MPEVKYESLEKLMEAALYIPNPRASIKAWIDNDNISFEQDGEKVFEIHPTDFIFEACNLLGISAEHV